VTFGKTLRTGWLLSSAVEHMRIGFPELLSTHLRVVGLQCGYQMPQQKNGFGKNTHFKSELQSKI
jgi:hypothetical protein